MNHEESKYALILFTKKWHMVTLFKRFDYVPRPGNGDMKRKPKAEIMLPPTIIRQESNPEIYGKFYTRGKNVGKERRKGIIISNSSENYKNKIEKSVICVT